MNIESYVALAWATIGVPRQDPQSFPVLHRYGLESLKEAGCDVEGLEFDPDLVIR